MIGSNTIRNLILSVIGMTLAFALFRPVFGANALIVWSTVTLGVVLAVLLRGFQHDLPPPSPPQKSIPRLRGVQPPRTRSRSTPEPVILPEPPLSTVYPHVHEAMIRAGYPPNHANLTVYDVGVLAIDDQRATTAHRADTISETADALQPFIVLHASTAAGGMIRFVMTTPAGDVLYEKTAQVQLKAGETRITAAKLLPVRERPPEGRLILKVYIESTPIAEILIQWLAPPSDVIKQHLRADGELQPGVDDALNQLIDADGIDTISLNELLKRGD